MGDAIFEAVELTKEFGTTTALRHVSLTLRGPSIIGLIGRNGSGKTTLLRHIVGLQLPTTGTARTMGADTNHLDNERLARIGSVPQNPAFLGWMTVGEQLGYLAGFYPRWDAERLRELSALLELRMEAPVNGLSAGNLRKLAILAATCPHPTLLLLDEPVSHLDPIIRDRFLKFLMRVVADDGATIVMSSHVLHDVESVVDWVICLHDGEVRADAALDTLKEAHGANLEGLFSALVANREH
jgi:ABC-2 type transport system ATP-binding protein